MRWKPNLKFIRVLAAGCEVLDYKYARQKGIPVTNVPANVTAAVGVLSANCIGTFMCICHLSADRDVATRVRRPFLLFEFQKILLRIYKTIGREAISCILPIESNRILYWGI